MYRYPGTQRWRKLRYGNSSFEQTIEAIQAISKSNGQSLFDWPTWAKMDAKAVPHRNFQEGVSTECHNSSMAQGAQDQDMDQADKLSIQLDWVESFRPAEWEG